MAFALRQISDEMLCFYENMRYCQQIRDYVINVLIELMQKVLVDIARPESLNYT